MAEVADQGGGEIKSVEEILQAPGNDELKFGLLIGLIRVNQVSNKDVVNTVLHLLVGGEFEIETSFVIQQSVNVLHMLRVLEECPVTLQAEIWSVFTAMLKKSRRNLNACTEVGLISLVLKMLESASDVVADLLVDMLGVLASYSITVKELRTLFSLLKVQNKQWPRHSVKLLSVLRQMPQRHGPDEFFSFPGKKGSFIALPPIRTWPYQNGWTFSCWIRLDPVTGVTVEREKPYLYSFRTSKGVGYSAHFLGSSLVITSMKIKGKGFQHCAKYEFQPRRWYMVTVVHVYYRWSRSELRCYVDGQLVSFTDMSWLVNTNDPFDKCFLGASSDGDPDTMFCGQMSTIYLFSDALSAQQVAMMYLLGPGYKSQFRFDNENSSLIGETAKRILYDGRMTSSILFVYNPIACDSQLCLESSPKGNASYFVHSPHALMLQDVKAVITHSLLSTLHSLGGAEVLFPLFGQLDNPVNCGPGQKPSVDYTICANLMGLMCDLLESSATIQEELLQNKGFLIISYLLEKSSREHIGPPVLFHFLKLTEYLVRLPTGSALLKHLFDHILFNPGVWIYASVEVQTKLYCYLATEFINDAQIYNNIRRVSAVLQTMHTLKYYYWVTNPKDRSGVIPKGTEGPRPTCDEIIQLRSFILLYVKELILKGQGILEDELQSMLNYLTTLHEDDNLMDVLQLIVTLMAQHPASMVPSFDRKSGIRTVYKLLASASEALRIQALKLLGFFLMRSTHKRKHDAMAPQNLFSLIGERLMLNVQTISIATYNVLFEILIERMTLEVPKEKHSEPESFYKLENPAILKVVATMIRQSKQNAELMEVKKMFLSDLTIMCNNNKENRRTLLQMSVWQEWLFAMAYIYPRSQDEQKITDMVMALFRMLLHHAIKFEYGGWRVWVDTLAILHSKVAYEDFRIHMSKMYQQYERQRVDNIADPGDRRHYPISTISGISDRQLQDEATVPKNTVVITDITDRSKQGEAPDMQPEPGELASGQKEDLPEDDESMISQNTLFENKGCELESSQNNLAGSEPESSQNMDAVNGKPDGGQVTVTSNEQKTNELAAVSSKPEVGQVSIDGTESDVGQEVPAVGHSKGEINQPGGGAVSGELENNSNDDVAVDQHSGSQTQSTKVETTDQSQKQNVPPEVIHFVDEIIENVISAAETKVSAVLKDLRLQDEREGEREHKSEQNEFRSASQGRPITLDRGEGPLDMGSRSKPSTEIPSMSRGRSQGQGNRHLFSPGPRAPPFRIPEFRWSYLHQKLLSDLLFSIETDIQVWKSHSTRAVVDFVNSGENHIYVVNVTHMISQLADNLIMSCGGLLPLLAAATSPNGEIEILEPNQGLSIEQAVSILQRIMNMTDIVVFTSSTNFSELEQEKNMPSGGILRQCLRLACTAAVRNCLECKHRYSPKTPTATEAVPAPPPPPTRQNSKAANGVDPIQSLIGGSHPSPKNIVENLGGQTTPIKDAEKLLQDMDITRLRAVVYRDVDETKQAQFLALAIVYFTSVLMVSKYRDILEPPSPASTPTLGPHRSTIHSPTSKEGSESRAEEEVLSVNETMENGLVAENSRADEDKEVDDECSVVEVKVEMHGKDECSEGEQQEAASLSSGRGGGEPDTTLEEAEGESKKDAVDGSPQGDGEATLASVADGEASEEPAKEALSESMAEKEAVTAEAAEELEMPQPEDKEASSKAATDGPQPLLPSPPQLVDSPAVSNTTTQEVSESPQDVEEAESREEEEAIRQEGISSIRLEEKLEASGTEGSSNPPEDLRLSTKIPVAFENLPLPSEGSSLTERLERALGSAAPLLREIFVDFAPFLSKTLIGSHGQELLVGGLVTLKQSTSVVELVMLLCSQEWQNSLQKHAGLAFIELVNEGRLLAHATRDHIVRVANEAEFILTRMRAEDVQKHAEFESLCAQTAMERKEEEKICDHLITSAKRRDHAIASKLRDKIINILTNKHGAWGMEKDDKKEFWKLDLWEDDSRRRRRFVKNHLGSTHPEATLKAAIEHGATEDAITQAREAFHSYLVNTKRGQQQVLDYTDEELLMEERDYDQEFAGPVALSTSCRLIAMGLSIAGMMSITKTDLYFELDEDDKQNKLEPRVLAYLDHLHGKWHFSEIRAVFSRRYLLQNVAIEIFMANRTAVMFSFPDHTIVKKVINALPRVGIGIKYGLPQARRMSLASGKQLFKLSVMTQKWQRREISNFDYLIYLNTVAGRTYNDLNQYPVFPWVIVNYDLKELDLSQPNNFRDLSKPIGALNPTRKKFFEERYASWDHDQVPPFHYGTHYSTAAFTLNWLIRIEPFTTLFLNMQGEKFDHANRTFFSISQAWKNCQRDTSDVKELIPEFFYLPEMFINENEYNFGKQDDGLVVNDVVLPPWAKNPEDFIRINRMALESEFVSCQLHHWIDLIFGYKQRGPEAVRATNVFYYLTYEGSVNLESMTDPVMKEAIENQIRSFGQTPSQLLTEPHPPRSSLMHLTPMMFSSVQDDLCMLMKFLSNSPITHVAANTHPAVPNPAVVTITCNHNFAINKWNPNYQQQGTPTSFSSEKHDREAELPVLMDQLFVQNTSLHRRTLGNNFDQRLKVTHSSFVTTADNRFIFACGFWDKSFRIFSTDSAKIVQIVYGHYDVVTCITRSECNINQDCYIITGSKDCSLMVWAFNARSQSIVGDNGSSDKPIPMAALTGHQSEVTCVAVLAELGLVVSGSKDGPCLVHTLNGDLLRSLDPPEGCHSPEIIIMSRETYILVKFDQASICSFTINGHLLWHVKHKDNILAMILSRDGEYLITGGDSGVAEVWRTHDLTLLYSFPRCDGSIRSLALTHNHRLLLLGLATGCLLVFYIDFNKWHHEYQDRY